MVVDRWRWLKRRLPRTANNESLLDVGCGTGAFTIGATRRGYRATGVSWDERNQAVASERARLCGAANASFVVGDVRRLNAIAELDREYDVVICLECVEHVLNDLKLFQDMSRLLRPGGRMLLTTPNYHYRPMSRGDLGPFATVETGAHVRRGYTASMLSELCARSGLVCSEVTFCGGYFSQMVTRVWRLLGRLTRSRGITWAIVLPLRMIPMLLPDELLSRLVGWPCQSICIDAYKPRFATADAERLERNYREAVSTY